MLSAADRPKYDAMIAQKIDDHPFIRQREFRDPVLAGLVLASAVVRDASEGIDATRLADASWQPFLWRSFRTQVTDGDSLVDGNYVGCLLSSFWNDPITDNPAVTIRPTQTDGIAGIEVQSYSGQAVKFAAVAPLVLQGMAKECDAKVTGTVRLQGHAPKTARPIFTIQGKTTLVCDELDIATEAMTLHGIIWLQAAAVTGTTDRLVVNVKNGATKVGWGGDLAGRYPWSQIRPTLGAPSAESSQDRLDELIDQCSGRLKGVLTLTEDYSPAEDDPDTRWALRSFRDEFPMLIGTLVANNYASSVKMSASGTARKVRVHLKKTWPQLRDLLRSDTAEGRTLRQQLRNALRLDD
jgi:hypothetical protein